MNTPSVNYFTSIVTGIVAALLACVLYIGGVIVIGFGLPLLTFQLGNAGAGVGSATIDSGTLVVVAIIGFALGFLWKVRRRSGRRVTH